MAIESAAAGMIPAADELYDVHLKELKQEGLLK